MNINEINRLNYINAINPDKQNDRFKKGKKFHSRIKNISRDGKVELELEDGIILEARLEERIAAGKPERGRVTLSAKTESGKVDSVFFPLI